MVACQLDSVKDDMQVDSVTNLTVQAEAAIFYEQSEELHLDVATISGRTKPQSNAVYRDVIPSDPSTVIHCQAVLKPFDLNVCDNSAYCLAGNNTIKIDGISSTRKQEKQWLKSEPDEKTPLLSGDVLSQAHTLRLLSIFCVFAAVLVDDSARGVVLPTQWQYLQGVGGGHAALGLMVAVFSLGRLVSVPAFGWLSDHASFGNSFRLSFFVVILGNLVYTAATTVRTLLLSRFVVGVGAGTLGMSRAYIVAMSSVEERRAYLAYLSAVQYVGFTVMPVLGSVFALVGDRSVQLGLLRVDRNTLPGWFLIVVNIAMLLVFFLWFEEPCRRDPTKIRHSRVSKTGPNAPPMNTKPGHTAGPTYVRHPCVVTASYDSAPPTITGTGHTAVPTSVPRPSLFTASNDSASPTITRTGYSAEPPMIITSIESTTPTAGVPTMTSTAIVKIRSEPTALGPVPLLAALTCILCNAVFRAVLAVMETVVTAVALELYHIDSAADGFIFSVLAVVGIAAYLTLATFSAHLQDQTLVISGLALLLLGSVVLTLSTTVAPSLEMFVGGVLCIWALAIPVGQTSILALFSKVLGPRPQGSWMGALTGMGSFARVTAPIASGLILHHMSHGALFSAVTVFVGIATALFLAALSRFPRLQP